MGDIRMKIWITLAAVFVFMLTFGGIMFMVNAANDKPVKDVFIIDKSMNTTINGVTYFFNYTRNEKVKCITDDGKVAIDTLCTAQKKNVTLDKNTVEFVNSTTPLIVVDKSKYIEIAGNKYEIQYVPNYYIHCICEKTKGCKVKECVI